MLFQQAPDHVLPRQSGDVDAVAHEEQLDADRLLVQAAVDPLLRIAEVAAERVRIVTESDVDRVRLWVMLGGRLLVNPLFPRRQGRPVGYAWSSRRNGSGSSKGPSRASA